MHELEAHRDDAASVTEHPVRESGTRRSETIDWWVAVVSPIACLLIAVPLFVALSHVSARVQPGAASPTAWLDAQQQADQAIALGRFGDAVRAWHEAYAEALVSRQWVAMAEVGDLSVRIGAATGSRTAAEARARECYFSALLRARRDGALDGVLRIAEAFARLGDRDVAEQALDVGAALAERRSPDARARYQHTAERLRMPALTVNGVAP